MLLITSTWGNRKTFRLIPATNESPYNEGIYDPEVGVLALIGKDKKETFQMVPRMNQFGDPEVLKIGKRPNGKDFAEERKAVDTYYEYYVESKDEIKALVKEIAVNGETFDYDQFMVEPEAPQPTSNIVTV
jgi:hypothetical protein